jgi:predicted phage tail protein
LLIGAGAVGVGAGITIAGVALSTILFGVGISLVLGGVAQLLTPTPKVLTGGDTEQDPRKSYSFSGIQNTSRQGTPVPIVYGETIVGSIVISAGIDTVQVMA